jgi:SSS family solute:Na+ symporter
MGFDSIYSAHGAFTAAVTPPLVVTLLLGVFWHRFSARAAFLTMSLGSTAIIASVVWPEIITPFAHGVPMKEVEEGFLAGKSQYKFMRGFFGLAVCSVIGLAAGFSTKAPPFSELRGLVWGTVSDAIRNFYGGRSGQEIESDWISASMVEASDDPFDDKLMLPKIQISGGLARAIEAQAGDIVYVTDSRWWLGGLKSSHAMVAGIDEATDTHTVHLGPNVRSRIVVNGREAAPLKVKRLY